MTKNSVPKEVQHYKKLIGETLKPPAEREKLSHCQILTEARNQ